MRSALRLLLLVAAVLGLVGDLTPADALAAAMRAPRTEPLFAWQASIGQPIKGVVVRRGGEVPHLLPAEPLPHLSLPVIAFSTQGTIRLTRCLTGHGCLTHSRPPPAAS